MAHDVVVVGAGGLLEGDRYLILLKARLVAGAESLALELGTAQFRHADGALVDALLDFCAPDHLETA